MHYKICLKIVSRIVKIVHSSASAAFSFFRIRMVKMKLPQALSTIRTYLSYILYFKPFTPRVHLVKTFVLTNYLMTMQKWAKCQKGIHQRRPTAWRLGLDLRVWEEKKLTGFWDLDIGISLQQVLDYRDLDYRDACNTGIDKKFQVPWLPGFFTNNSSQ